MAKFVSRRSFESGNATHDDVSGYGENSVTAAELDSQNLSLLELRLLIGMFRRVRSRERPVRYAPAEWLKQRPTPKLRQRWSRATRRMAAAGLIERITEPSRDRVTHVRVTQPGWQTIESVGLLEETRVGMIEESSFVDSATDPNPIINWQEKFLGKTVDCATGR